MPKTTKQGKAIEAELPATLRRSDAKAKRTFAKAHDAALREYGSEARAHRVAFSALKHSYEKVGDHWEAKAKRGPSDSRARSGGPHPRGKSAEGVNASATKEHLMKLAQRLDVSGRSKMNKSELITALKKASRKATAARS